MTQKIILASGSPFRKAMLLSAGVDVEAVPAEIDEGALEAPLQDSGVSPEDVALVLAEAKATEVSERSPGALGLGGHDPLPLGDEGFNKPADREGARRHLLALS